MKLKINRRPASFEAAFTLVEVLVSVAIVGFMAVSFYGGITSGYAVINVARENLRATQIMIERIEVMRLYTWDQVNSNGFIPTNFSASFYPMVATNGQSAAVTNGGVIYYGSISFSNAPVSSNYSGSMKLVTVNLNWTNGTYKHSRSMQTLVSQNGLQKYVY